MQLFASARSHSTSNVHNSSHTDPVFVPPVRGEVVHRDLHALFLLQLPERRDQQLEVERSGTIEQ